MSVSSDMIPSQVNICINFFMLQKYNYFARYARVLANFCFLFAYMQKKQ